MISREGPDDFHLNTVDGTIDLRLTKSALLDRLRATGLWSDENLQRIADLEIGEETRRPYGVYS